MLIHRGERDTGFRPSRRTGGASAQWTHRFVRRLLRKDDAAPGRVVSQKNRGRRSKTAPSVNSTWMATPPLFSELLRLCVSQLLSPRSSPVRDSLPPRG